MALSGRGERKVISAMLAATRKKAEAAKPAALPLHSGARGGRRRNPDFPEDMGVTPIERLTRGGYAEGRELEFRRRGQRAC